MRQAEQYASLRQWPAAIQAYQQALALRPGDANLHVQLSYVHSLAGHYRLAHQHALAAHAARPSEPAVIRELVARLRTFNQPWAILQTLERLKPLDRMPIPLLLAFATQLSNLNEQEQALALLDEAKRADPLYPPTLVARAQVLVYLGRFAAAEQDLQACLRRAPEIAQAWWLISKLRRQTNEANHVARLQSLLAGNPARPGDVEFLEYALHKELDDLGDHAGAAAALERACEAKRARLVYSSEESRALVDALIRMPAGDATGAGGEAREGGDGAKIPIFIVGMHRSGTTLLEQLLDGHDDIRGVGELYDFTTQMRWATDHHCKGVIDATIVERASGLDWPAVGSGYLQGMQWRLGGERCFTDKLPSNFLNIGFICQALPQARILHMVRDPVEVAFSNLRELFSDANPYSYDQAELAAFHQQYQRLMAHWHQRWPGRILDVSYQRLTRDTEAVLREVCDFCGLQFQPSMLALRERSRGVATASAVQVRGEVHARDVPKWAPYADYLQPFIRTMASAGAADRRGL
ncbi:tetratricopeptide repeat-containing sulfotransferase family protein [Pseudoxanthomonas dokdonensis]|uniref:tetratricopeptide repeat-containing sulfotransferase family protein n=1 Tax=Pseudoxanthomonas dokdonensis TaxID=344882 RepID=UPI00147697B6|nr:sulfotransferase [Pseudoxanthomonas dokdonensis]